MRVHRTPTTTLGEPIGGQWSRFADVIKTPTLKALARRERVLPSILALAAACVALAKILDVQWLALLGVLLAVVGGIVRVAIVLRRAGVEKEQEAIEQKRRTRVSVKGLADVVPTEIGIDAAAPQTILPGEGFPAYLQRETDGELETAVREALNGSGRWIVVAVGTSKVGKSRTLFEALRRCAQNAELDFVAPADADALKSLLTPGEMPALEREGNVLWLDDLEPFINQGMTLQILQEWHERAGKCVVAGTYGGKGSDIVAGSGSDSLATIADEVLQRSCEIHVRGTNTRELDPLRAQVPDDAMRSIERHGLAAYLVAAPKLERKLDTGFHAAGEPQCREDRGCPCGCRLGSVWAYGCNSRRDIVGGMARLSRPRSAPHPR